MYQMEFMQFQVSANECTKPLVTISDVTMGVEKQSADSLVDKKKQKPDTTAQTYQLLSSCNTQNASSFIGGNHATDSKDIVPLNNSLSPDIQKEAFDYLLQLKKQSQSLAPTDTLIYNPTLSKMTANNFHTSPLNQDNSTHQCM